MSPPQRVVVVGGSAGGLEVLARVVAHLPEDLPAAVLVVLHFPRSGVSNLAAILSRSTRLSVTTPWDGEPLEAGRLYVPAPDQHLLVGRGRVRLSRAPRENGHRPAINPLFRTAARHYGGAAIGVVLCGNRDDGSAGLLAIRRAGGIGVVIDPDDCAFADIPGNAVSVAQPDHVVGLDAMGPLLVQLVAQDVLPGRPVPVMAGTEETLDARRQADVLRAAALGSTDADPAEAGG